MDRVAGIEAASSKMLSTKIDRTKCEYRWLDSPTLASVNHHSATPDGTVRKRRVGTKPIAKRLEKSALLQPAFGSASLGGLLTKLGATPRVHT